MIGGRSDLERRLSRRLGSAPWLRESVAYLYQAVLAVVSRAAPLAAAVPMRRVRGCFFGFHDKCPWDAPMQRILCHRVPTDASFRDASPIEVGFVHAGDLRFEPLAETRAWNWQQGAMLQWTGADDIVFNAWDGGTPVTRVLRGARSLTHPGHICAVARVGELSLGYSFTRPRRCAADYAYWFGSAPPFDEDRAPVEDGLFLTDLESGTRRLLTSIKALASSVNSESADYHFITHATFNRSASSFAHYHRWRAAGGPLRTRLLVSATSGELLGVAPIGSPSHYCWDGDDALIITDSDSGGACYSRWVVGEARAVGLSPLLLQDDGHPQVSPADPRLLITDTYPDRWRRQSLLLADRSSGEVCCLLQEVIDLRFRRENRCDYHPRWRPDGRQVCVDTSGDGTRSLAILELSSVLAADPAASALSQR